MLAACRQLERVRAEGLQVLEQVGGRGLEAHPLLEAGGERHNRGSQTKHLQVD